jgi:hypothetical protein
MGQTEYIQPNVNAIVVEEMTPEALARAIHRLVQHSWLRQAFGTTDIISIYLFIYLSIYIYIYIYRFPSLRPQTHATSIDDVDSTQRYRVSRYIYIFRGVYIYRYAHLSKVWPR